eukprot:Blabericola_migrator_1__4971@NODE_2587_length_2569_cov_215_384492_g1620_i0_p2_GENE_NODE_2587_length_2569_cov_215_384492_g1620_i0NODE_2587_length_2569_cov_215_384492_g1620_i0_p2_ORF_typecomplete_len224_score57_18EMG1/PF03587_14/0_0015_NODE_2587_length_2569_cov_215_384492_g1620_i014142085
MNLTLVLSNCQFAIQRGKKRKEAGAVVTKDPIDADFQKLHLTLRQALGSSLAVTGDLSRVYVVNKYQVVEISSRYKVPARVKDFYRDLEYLYGSRSGTFDDSDSKREVMRIMSQDYLKEVASSAAYKVVFHNASIHVWKDRSLKSDSVVKVEECPKTSLASASSLYIEVCMTDDLEGLKLIAPSETEVVRFTHLVLTQPVTVNRVLNVIRSYHSKPTELKDEK